MFLLSKTCLTVKATQGPMFISNLYISTKTVSMWLVSIVCSDTTRNKKILKVLKFMELGIRGQ